MTSIKKKIKDWTPETKIKAGQAYRGMPSELYHQHPALSNSGLKTLLDCPARYYYKYLSGECELKETPAQKIGKASHCYILEGEKAFTQRYWHNPYSGFLKDETIAFLCVKGFKAEELKKQKTTELKALLLKTMGIEPKEIELNKNELNQVISLARAINKNPQAKGAFSQKGESEVSLFWNDPETGVMLKCRPDWLPYDCLDIPDYKTTSSVNPAVFAKDFVKYGYHIQSAFYRMGIKEVFGIDVQNFFFVAQEKEPPCITQCFNPDMGFVEFGEKAIRLGIEVFLDCKERGIWETDSDEVIEMSLGNKPDDLAGYFDKKNAIVYLPYWIDSEFEKYEVV